MISSHLTLFDPPFFTQSRNSLKICTLHNEADFVMRWQIEFWQFAFPSTSQNSWHISEMKNWVNPLRLDLINCNWILRFLVLKIEFDKLDFLSSLNWIFEGYTVWQYRLWSFQTGYTKLERFLHKNQHNQRKLLNFENWTNGGPQ